MKNSLRKCDCGGELYLIEEVVYQKKRRLLSNGKLAKKMELDSTGLGDASWLQCELCDKEYNYEPIGNEKWERGEERS